MKEDDEIRSLAFRMRPSLYLPLLAEGICAGDRSVAFHLLWAPGR